VTLPDASASTTSKRQLSLTDVVLRARSRPGWFLHDLPPSTEELSDLPRALQGARLWYRLRQGGYTMLGLRRGRYLFRLAADTERRGLPGDLVDCGVWNGGSSVLLSRGAPSRRLWAFDSFEGLPEPTAEDGGDSAGYAGECNGAEAKVHEAFAIFANPGRLTTVKGWFEDTFPARAAEVGQIAVLHADGDWYDSVLLTLRTFYKKVVPGGYVIVDDYDFWKGAAKATDEFRREAGITDRLVHIDGNAVYWQVSG
jgi:O-methyltransferase